jgi:hypothetical protein
MRLRIVLIALLTMMHYAAWSQQEVLISGRYTNATLSDILSQWSRNFSLDFAFDSHELSKYKATIEFRNQPVKEALTALLVDAPFSHQQLDGTFIIYPIAKVVPNVSSIRTTGQVLSGNVIDALSGEPLPFAVVAMLMEGSSVACDEFGNFSLTLSANGLSDTLLATFVGYSPAQWALKDIWSEKPIQILLVPQATMLSDVKVEEKRNQFEAGVTSMPGIFIKPDDVQARFGLGEADLLRIAQQQTGVAGSLEMSNGLVLRGGASDQSLLLMDGFTIYHQDHFFGMFSAVNAFAVKAMRLQKGIADIELGGRASGALELWGKEGDLRKASGRIECGTLSISGAVEAPLDTSGKASVFICARRSLTDAFRSPAYRELFNTLYSGAVAYGSSTKLDAFDLNFQPRVQFQDINAKLTYHPADNTRINLSLYASRDDLEFAYADTADSQLLDVTDVRYSDETNKMNRGVSLRWQQRYSDCLQSNTIVGFSLFQGNYFSTDSISNNLFLLDTNQFGYREISLSDWSVKHHWQWNRNNHEWKGGLAMNVIQTFDRLRSSIFFDENEQLTANVFTVFAGDTWRPNKHWRIQYGTRLNFFRERSQLYPEPRLIIAWQMRPKRLSLKMSATRSFQFIQRTSSQNLYQNTPDIWRPAVDDIPVLMAYQLSFGCVWSARQWSIDVEAYSKWNQGQVTNAQLFKLNAGAGGEIISVVGAADIRGMDALLQWKMQNHIASLGYSWMNARSYYPDISPSGIRESFVRSHEVKANYTWKRNGWNLSFLQIITDGAPFTALNGFYTFNLPGSANVVLPVSGSPNSTQTPWYIRTDVVAGYEWNWGAHRLTLQGAVYNLFNRTNLRAIQYNVVPKAETVAGYTVAERSIQMIGRVPSLHLSWQF